MKAKDLVVIIMLIPFILLVIKVLIIEGSNYSNFTNWLSLHLNIIYRVLSFIWGILMKLLTNKFTLAFWNNIYFIGAVDAIFMMFYFVLTGKGGKKR